MTSPSNALPATGANWATAVRPGLNPLSIRYWQTTNIFARDYFNADGTVFDLSNPAVGLGTDGLFTPLAADGSIRTDLFVTSSGTNQGFYHLGELKVDAVDVTPDMTVQETPTASSVRTVRNVLTKLDDEFAFTPLEDTPIIKALRWELPLASVPALGTPGFQMSRGAADYLQNRIFVALGTDGDGNLMYKVFPNCQGKKKGKEELGRKEPDSQELRYSTLVDPATGMVMWEGQDGVQWRGMATSPAFSAAPVATAIAGGKATLAFPTPSGDGPYTYTVLQQSGGAGTYSGATLSGIPNVSGSTTTLTVSALTAGTSYTFQVVAQGTNNQTGTSPASNAITATT